MSVQQIMEVVVKDVTTLLAATVAVAMLAIHLIQITTDAIVSYRG